MRLETQTPLCNGFSCQSCRPAATIVAMSREFMPSESQRSLAGASHGHFAPGSMVVATLSNPREKFWGMILALALEGLSLSGAELASFDDLTTMVKEGDPFTPAVLFFPMHRIERVELDLPDGSLPSLSQRFLSKTGLEPASVLMPGDVDRVAAEDRSADSAPSASKERA